MAKHITDQMIRMAEQLERLAQLRASEQKGSEFGVREIHGSRQVIEKLHRLNPSAEASSYVSRSGSLIYKIKFY